jgi:ferritin-like protein
MDRAARETVVNAGVDVDALIDKLVAAAGAEFAAGYYYTILRMRSIGLDDEGLTEVIEDARVEDRNHFEALVPRIYELGGKLPDDIRAFADQAGCPDAYPPGSPGLGGLPGTEDLLTVLVEAERCAIRTYTDICHFTAGKDHRTYELALAILNEEIEHEAWFSELLGEGPSGHFRRGGPGESPYVGRFMTAEGASR